MSKKEQIFRKTTLLFCQLFTIFTIITLISAREYHRLPMALATILLLLLPDLCQKLAHLRFPLPLYLVTLFYALGPMLGQCYGLYYRLCWWDKLLHAMGGVLFAMVGLFLFRRFLPEAGRHTVMAAVFALCFSMAISVAWEFCEFAADTFLGMDMQQDTLVTELHSYLLGQQQGVTGSICGITQVTVNGQTLPGYIDIGLHDTMTDMLWESLGALAAAVVYLLRKGKHMKAPERL